MLSILIIIIFMLFLLAFLVRKCFFTSWDKGMYGESVVESIILRMSPNYKVLRNLYIPFGNNTTEIDLIWISNKGIFVIESKNYSGWIFGNEKSQYWMSVYYNHRYRFFNPIIQNRIHINCLRNIIHEKVSYYNIVSFSDRANFKEMHINSKNVYVTHYIKLKNLLIDLYDNSSCIISDEDVASIYEKLLNYTFQYIDKDIIDKHDKYVFNKKVYNRNY